MKKAGKLIIAVLVFVILYAALYYFLVMNAPAEEYDLKVLLFRLSLIYAIFGILVGLWTSNLIERNNFDNKRRYMLYLPVAFIFGDLFGWISLIGIFIGHVVGEKKDEKTVDKIGIFDLSYFKEIKSIEWGISAIISFIILMPIIFLYNNNSVKPSAFVLGLTFLLLCGLITSFLKDSRTKTTPALTPFQTVAIRIFILVIALEVIAIIMSFNLLAIAHYINPSDAVYINLAIEQKDPVLCEKISKQSGYDSRDACYSNLAEINKDARLCEKIQTIQTASGTGTRDTCFYNLADALGDANLCEKIMQDTDIVYKDACYQNVAVTTGNADICNKIKKQTDENVDIESKDNCFGSLGIILKNPTLCEKAGIFKDECLKRSK